MVNIIEDSEQIADEVLKGADTLLKDAADLKDYLPYILAGGGLLLILVLLK